MTGERPHGAGLQRQGRDVLKQSDAVGWTFLLCSKGYATWMAADATRMVADLKVPERGGQGRGWTGPIGGWVHRQGAVPGGGQLAAEGLPFSHGSIEAGASDLCSAGRAAAETCRSPQPRPGILDSCFVRGCRVAWGIAHSAPPGEPDTRNATRSASPGSGRPGRS